MSTLAALQAMQGKTSGSTSVNSNQELTAAEFNNLVTCLIDTIQNRLAVRVSSTGNGLIGTQDGVNLTFFVPEGEYVADTLLVFLSGNPMSNGNGIIESNPSTGEFQFVVSDPSDAPVNTDVIIEQHGYIN